MGLIQKIFGSRNQRELNKLQPNVNRINQLEATYKAMSDAELKAVTATFKEKLDNGASLDDILCDAFAAIREASVRTTGMRHYDVQMVGGMVLHAGRIAEMRTGEGKTLVATLPTYLNALTGQGVHVVTVNDYLAKRDAEWMGRIHGFLGLRTGVIVHGLDDFDRQKNYNADITYGQNNEFGFDYLRDNMKTSPDRMVQRGLNYAVVDEVDSILIDEARTPLIISGASEASGDLYVKVDRLIPRLKRDVDYTVDEKAHSAMLTDEGVEVMEKLLGVDNLFESTNIQLVHHVSNALRAHTLYKRNVNYLVEDQKVVIVDEHTGRKMPGRRWSDGLHQAIEAKEGVEVEEENQTLATVTFQNYFRMYKKLSGMTGTADTEAQEFHQIYKLDVTVIPTNKPIRRTDQPDLVYKNEAGKFRAVAEDIEDCHKRGQPVLVGTVSVEKSEVVANILKSKGLPFNVLNAKQHQREASIVAQAGRKGAITIATNMAGRGTDIILGGNFEAMAKDALAEERTKLAEEAANAKPGEGDGSDGSEGSSNPYRGSSVPDFDEEKRLKELMEEFKVKCDAEREEVLEAGGLKIVGTERHESRRIDNQLRGRAGRQGDPGSSRFYLSLQDDLLRIFGLDKMTGLMERLGLEEDVPIESPMVTRSIENAQKKVEGRNFDQRKNVLEYDDVMNQQRKTIYALRRQILEGRYQPEQTEDDKKKGIEHAPVQFSGDWTQETIRPEVEKPLADMIHIVKSKVREKDLGNKLTTLTEDEQKWLDEWKKDPKNNQQPLHAGDDRPGWRIFRAEVWRQFGTLLDIEKRWEKDTNAELLEYCSIMVAASLIQQRERLYDVSHAQMASIIEKVLSSDVAEDEWDWEQLDQALTETYDIPFELDHGTPDEAAEQVWPEIEEKLTEREKELSRAWLMYFMRHFYLEEIDKQWIEHLKTMDALREGIGLMGYGQKDPKKEYKKAGFSLFAEMMDRIQEEVTKKIFNVHIKREEETVPELQKEKKRQMVERGVADKNDDDVDAEVADKAAAGRGKGGKARTAGEGATTAPVKRDRPKVGRNDPCPCGSGKKYKKCHGKDDEAAAEG
jgi:preprotein translocase subunit SecA